jgi:uncharacterized membrane protein
VKFCMIGAHIPCALQSNIHIKIIEEIRSWDFSLKTKHSWRSSPTSPSRWRSWRSFIITISIIYAIYRYLVGLVRHQQVEICISDFKHAVGRGVQVALELLIAADIINTVVLDATITNVLVLGLLVIIRTFLSWTLMLETEGHLPWWHRKPDQ